MARFRNDCIRRRLYGDVKYILPLTFGAHAAPLEDLSTGQVGKIELVSSTPEQRWAMIRNNRARIKPTVVTAELLMPSGVTGKVPAVVFSHGSDGITPTMYDVWAKALLTAGFAVFIVDSFKPRGISTVSGDAQLSYNMTTNISDAIHALKALSTHPQIDSSRIFHLGWSRGGNAVLDAAFPAYVRTVAPEGVHWAGSVALYPGCTTRYRVDHLGSNPGPLLLLLGGADDMTPAQACVEFAKQLSAEGHRVSTKVYPGAYHVFDRVSQPRQQFREGHFASCNLEVKMDVQGEGIGRGFDYMTNKSITTAAELGEAFRACQKIGWITVESNNAARERAVQDVLDFLRSSK